MKKAIFLDRDDTINYDPGFLKEPSKVKLYPLVAEGIKQLREELGYIIIVISNQSGITRGLLTHDDVLKVNDRINEILSEFSTKIDAFYFCPYHPDFDSEEKCKCRKPSPQMVYDAASDFDIDLNRSFFIGDRVSDIQCGKNAGLRTILVKNTISTEHLTDLKINNIEPDFVANNFQEIVNYIKKHP